MVDVAAISSVTMTGQPVAATGVSNINAMFGALLQELVGASSPANASATAEISIGQPSNTAATLLQNSFMAMAQASAAQPVDPTGFIAAANGNAIPQTAVFPTPPPGSGSVTSASTASANIGVSTNAETTAQNIAALFTSFQQDSEASNPTAALLNTIVAASVAAPSTTAAPAVSSTTTSSTPSAVQDLAPAQTQQTTGFDTLASLLMNRLAQQNSSAVAQASVTTPPATTPPAETQQAAVLQATPLQLGAQKMQDPNPSMTNGEENIPAPGSSASNQPVQSTAATGIIQTVLQVGPQTTAQVNASAAPRPTSRPQGVDASAMDVGKTTGNETGQAKADQATTDQTDANQLATAQASTWAPAAFQQRPVAQTNSAANAPVLASQQTASLQNTPQPTVPSSFVASDRATLNVPQTSAAQPSVTPQTSAAEPAAVVTQPNPQIDTQQPLRPSAFTQQASAAQTGTAKFAPRTSNTNDASSSDDDTAANNTTVAAASQPQDQTQPTSVQPLAVAPLTTQQTAPVPQPMVPPQSGAQQPTAQQSAQTTSDETNAAAIAAAAQATPRATQPATADTKTEAKGKTTATAKGRDNAKPVKESGLAAANQGQPQSNAATTQPAEPRADNFAAQLQTEAARQAPAPNDKPAQSFDAAALQQQAPLSSTDTAKVSAQIQVGPQHQTADTSTTLDKLGVSIAAKSSEGLHQFDIRLDPVELGRVHVHLTVDDSGQTQANVVVDKQQTLDLLQRDASGLNRALQDAGLNLSNNGLNFSLREQYREANTGSQGKSRNLSAEAVLSTDAPQSRSSQGSYAPNSVKLDISV